MDIIAQLRLSSPTVYVPHFSITQHGIFWIVADHDTPIAVVVRDTIIGGAMLEVLKFSPQGPGRPVAIPPYDYHYNTRMGYGASFNWSVDYMFQSPDRDTLTLVESTAERIIFVHDGEFDNGMVLHAELAIGYDPDCGQYRYDMCWDIDSPFDTLGEFSNVFHGNLMHTDMDRREYDYGCYVRAGGSWEKYPITNMVTSLQHGRLVNIPLELGGGSGHINRNGVVPMIVHRVSNVPVIMGSCTVCFDLHQSARVRAGEHAHIESRFVDAGPIFAAAPDAATLISLDEQTCYRFHLGELCDFTRTVSRAEPWSGGIWRFNHLDSAGISEECAHSGTRSLELRAKAGKAVSIQPCLSALSLDNHSDYELTVWVKVDGDDAVARIELTAFRFTQAQPHANAIAILHGMHDWTPLTLRINSGRVDNGMLTLALTGPGCAWFDEILLQKAE